MVIGIKDPQANLFTEIPSFVFLTPNATNPIDPNNSAIPNRLKNL